MKGRAIGVVLMAVLLPAMAPSRPLQAQASLSATQNLVFGQLTPGVPKRIAPTDVINRGEYHMTGVGTFSVMFSLPANLASTTTSATIPISFGATDAVIKKGNQSTTFDPRAGTSIKLTNGQGDADIMLGGTATPAAGQLAGTYQATITVYYIQTG
jgi:hypothetical protein